MTDKTTETPAAPAKPSKTKLAREASVAILKKANRPMPVAEIIEKTLADKQVAAAGIPKAPSARS
jgi:hypothetical protein